MALGSRFDVDLGRLARRDVSVGMEHPHKSSGHPSLQKKKKKKKMPRLGGQ